MIIGIDIDEVLSETIDFVLTLHQNTLGGRNVSREDIYDYYLPNMVEYGISREESVNLFITAQQSEESLEAMKPVEGAYQKLKAWQNLGYSFHAITARGEPLRSITEQRLEKHFPGIFQQVTFCNHYREDYPTYHKEDICIKEGIKIFVEDNPRYAIDLEKLGIKVYLLDKPWNRTFEQEKHPGVIKVKSWSDIVL